MSRKRPASPNRRTAVTGRQRERRAYEDAIDCAAFDERADEPIFSQAELLADLKANGRL
jgi:hypothetical protein